MTSIPTALPAAQTGAGANVVHKGAHGKHGFDFASLFGAQTAQNAQAQAASFQLPLASATQSANTDLLAQLTAQLQSGTPLSQVVDQISQSVSQAVAQQLKGKYSASDLNRLTTMISQSIASALSPPSNAPPGNAAEQAATLAARLQQLVESLARDTQNGAGQQNELSGTILDAISAKDIPAQQQTSGTPTSGKAPSPGASSAVAVVRSLLAGALSALQTQNATLASQSSASSTIATLPQTDSTSASSQPSLPATTPSAQNAPITIANAPDLLARMLVRAAGADAAINGAAPVAAGTQPQGPSLPSPSALAARFAALLGENANAIGSSGGTGGSASNDASTSGNTGHSFEQTSQPTFANTMATPSPISMSAQVQNALNGSSSTGTPIDANAVIEQMVRGMVMRTDPQGTSEIRLTLQPENLGNVTMRLSVTGTQVSATVIAQNADVGNTILTNHQQLAKSLADAGLTLSGLSVNVSGGETGEKNRDQSSGFGRRYTVHELAGAAPADGANDQSSGPQLISRSSLDLFNYLA